MVEKTVLRLLAYKSQTTEELRKKLTLKGFSMAEIEPVIQKMIRSGYLNDQEAAERRFQIYLQKGYGPCYIALKMKQQGLNMPPYPMSLQRQIASKLLKTTSFQRKDRAQKGAALQRRGFELELIYELLLDERY